MPYRFLDDIATADIAFEATGKDLNELFRSAADATLVVMLEDIGGLHPIKKRSIILQNTDVQELMFQFLQEIIYLKDAECLLLKVVELNIVQDDDGYHLVAELQGEEVDIQRHIVNVDVKAVTYHLFTFRRTGDGYVATVVLDI